MTLLLLGWWDSLCTLLSSAGLVASDMHLPKFPSFCNYNWLFKSLKWLVALWICNVFLEMSRLVDWFIIWEWPIVVLLIVVFWWVTLSLLLARVSLMFEIWTWLLFSLSLRREIRSSCWLSPYSTLSSWDWSSWIISCCSWISLSLASISLSNHCLCSLSF